MLNDVPFNFLFPLKHCSLIVAINVLLIDTFRYLTRPFCLACALASDEKHQDIEDEEMKRIEQKARPTSAKDVVRLNIKLYAVYTAAPLTCF